MKISRSERVFLVDKSPVAGISLIYGDRSVHETTFRKLSRFGSVALQAAITAAPGSVLKVNGDTVPGSSTKGLQALMRIRRKGCKPEVYLTRYPEGIKAFNVYRLAGADRGLGTCARDFLCKWFVQDGRQIVAKEERNPGGLITAMIGATNDKRQNSRK